MSTLIEDVIKVLDAGEPLVFIDEHGCELHLLNRAAVAAVWEGPEGTPLLASDYDGPQCSIILLGPSGGIMVRGEAKKVVAMIRGT